MTSQVQAASLWFSKEYRLNSPLERQQAHYQLSRSLCIVYCASKAVSLNFLIYVCSYFPRFHCNSSTSNPKSSHTWHLSSHIWHFSSQLWHFSSHIWHFSSHLWHFSSHLWHFSSHIWHFNCHYPTFTNTGCDLRLSLLCR
jgi:hypothetical protein